MGDELDFIIDKNETDAAIDKTKEKCDYIPRLGKEVCKASMEFVRNNVNTGIDTLNQPRSSSQKELDAFMNGTGLSVKYGDETQPTTRSATVPATQTSIITPTPATQTPTNPSRLELSKDERNELLNYFQAYNLPFDAK